PTIVSCTQPKKRRTQPTFAIGGLTTNCGFFQHFGSIRLLHRLQVASGLPLSPSFLKSAQMYLFFVFRVTSTFMTAILFSKWGARNFALRTYRSHFIGPCMTNPSEAMYQIRSSPPKSSGENRSSPPAKNAGDEWQKRAG